MALTQPSLRARPTVSVALAILLSGLPAARAETPAGAGAPDVELTPFAGYRGGGSFEDAANGRSLDLDEDGSYGLILNIDHDRNTQWEFMLSRQRTALQPGPAASPQFDLDVTHFSGGGIYVWRDERIEPFIGAGLGATHFSPRDPAFDGETELLFQLVGGYKYWLTRHLGLRVEVRGYAVLMDTDAEVFCGGGACVASVDSSGVSQLEINAGLSVRF